jgi:protein-tyrosine kinase
VSLVEQAIARLRRQQAGTAKAGAASGSLPEQLEETANLDKQVAVDSMAVRTRGYLPETDQEGQFADHFRRIKGPLIDKALSDNVAASEPRVIMITSALPGDGKTFTSINLALSMSLERDISVLLVDSDVAKRHVSEIFGLSGQMGLLDALVNETLDAESLIVPTSLRGFSILPAGGRVEGTAELLSSNRMRKIVTGLCTRNSRRILLLDSPPLLITNEGRGLLKIAGQVVLVVRAGQTPRHAVQAAIEMIDEQQAGGVVLNQVNPGLTEGYYRYGAYGTDSDAP